MCESVQCEIRELFDYLGASVYMELSIFGVGEPGERVVVAHSKSNSKYERRVMLCRGVVVEVL